VSEINRSDIENAGPSGRAV